MVFAHLKTGSIGWPAVILVGREGEGNTAKHCKQNLDCCFVNFLGLNKAVLRLRFRIIEVGHVFLSKNEEYFSLILLSFFGVYDTFQYIFGRFGVPMVSNEGNGTEGGMVRRR